jgi:hypothetical protein
MVISGQYVSRIAFKHLSQIYKKAVKRKLIAISVLVTAYQKHFAQIQWAFRNGAHFLLISTRVSFYNFTIFIYFATALREHQEYVD